MAVLSITPANVLPSASATIRLVTAGEAVTRGQVAYLKSADKRYWKATAVYSDDGPSTAKIAGIFAADAAAGQKVPLIVKDPELAIGDNTEQGNAYVVGLTAGTITRVNDLYNGATAWYFGLVGIGLGTGKLRVDFTQPYAGFPGATD